MARRGQNLDSTVRLINICSTEAAPRTGRRENDFAVTRLQKNFCLCALAGDQAEADID